jgi:hypothetical protein
MRRTNQPECEAVTEAPLPAHRKDGIGMLDDPSFTIRTTAVICMLTAIETAVII